MTYNVLSWTLNPTMYIWTQLVTDDICSEIKVNFYGA